MNLFKILSFFLIILPFNRVSSQCLQVLSHQKISDTRGYFNALIDNSDLFGTVAHIGDLDGNGIGDIVVGAKLDDDGGTNRGAVYIVFLDEYGRALSFQKISSTQGGFSTGLDDNDEFGSSVAYLGDLNNDNSPEIAVGSPSDDDGGPNRGAIWIISLNSDGTVRNKKKISDTQGGFNGVLAGNDNFGSYVGNAQDINGDGNTDLVVGSPHNDDGGTNRGAVYILFLDTSRTVISEQKISDTAGDFLGILDNDDNFGQGVGIGDLNGDGKNDIVVGAFNDDDGGLNRGAIYILFLDTTGKVLSHQKVSDTAGNFNGILSNNGRFGTSVTSAGDLNSDNIIDLIVSAEGDNDGGTGRGAFWILLMDANGKVGTEVKVSDTENSFVGKLDDGDLFGSSISFMGDYNSDGLLDIAVGAVFDDDGGIGRGAVWIISIGCLTGCSGFDNNQFQMAYGMNATDYAHSITNTSDGGYIFCGTTNSRGAGLYDWFVTKINSIGDTSWSRTIGGSGNDIGNSVKIKEMPNGGYLVSGRTYGFGTSGGGGMYLVKLDNQGNIVWDKILDGIANEHARDVEFTNDSAMMVIGTNGFVNKFDLTGTRIWNRYVSGGGNMHIYDVQIDSDKKEYTITGNSTGYGSGGSTGYVISFDSIGNKNWERIYNTQYYNGYTTAIQTDDKGFILGGLSALNSSSSGDRLWLTRIDSVGDVVWSRYYSDFGNSRGRIIHLIKDHNSGFIVTAFLNYSTTHKNLLMKIDEFGNSIWAKVYRGSADNAESLWSENVVKTNDNGFMYYVNSPNQITINSGHDVVIMKTDGCGNMGCDEITVNIESNEQELVHSNPTSSITTWGTLSNVSSVIDTFNVDTNLLCRANDLCMLEAMFYSDTVCVGDTTNFYDLSWDSLANLNAWHWYFGDGDSNFLDQNPSHRYDTAGTYLARLIVFNDDTLNCSDTIDLPVVVLDVPNPQLGSDTTYCLGYTATLLPVQGTFTYLWSDSSTMNSLPVNSSGTYYVSVSNNACSATDTVVLNFLKPPLFDLGPDTTICQGDSIFISLGNTGVSFLWSDSTTSNYNTLFSAGTHWLMVDSAMCKVYDSINLNVIQYPVFNLGNDSIICYGDTLVLIGGPASLDHNWSTGDSTNFITIDSGGVYWLELSSGYCVSTDTIEYSTGIKPQFTLGNDTILCEGDTLAITTNLSLTYPHNWNIGSVNNIIYVDTTGLFSVIVSNGLCTRTDSILVIVEDSLNVELGPDTSLCEGTLYVLNAFNTNANYLWNNLNTSSSLSILNSGTYWVEVTSMHATCRKSDTVNIIIDSMPQIELGNDIYGCIGDTFQIKASWPGALILWDDATSDSMVIITTSSKRWVTVKKGLCETSDTLNAVLYDVPLVNLDSLMNICEGDTLLVNIDSLYSNYYWSNSDSTYFTTYTDSGYHWVEVRNQICIASDTFFLSLMEGPYINLNDLYEICESGYVDIDAGNAGAGYLWSDGSTNQVNRIRDTGTIYISIINSNGCRLEDSTYVDFCEFKIHIPNTITPNGDGSNDTWIIDNIHYYPGNNVQIFNRNGQLLFEASNYQNNWNGTWEGGELPASVYFYIVDLGGEYSKFKGTLTIIR